MKTRIPFIGRIDEAEGTLWTSALSAALTHAELRPLKSLSIEERMLAEVAIVANPDPSDLAALPNLKWIQSLWAGVERLIVEIPDPSIKVVRMQDPQLAETMAEAVLAWTLYLHRDMPRYRSQQKERQWQQHDLPLPSDRTVGILGLGNLGKQAAAKLSQNGFKVCGWSRSETSLPIGDAYSGNDGFSEILQQSNILVVLLPLTQETHGLLNTETLDLLPVGASVMNFARGPIIDSNALIQNLNSDHLNHAVLDVFDQEPLSSTSALWQHPKITILPHISAPTNKTTASLIAATNIENFLQNGTVPKSVCRALGY